MTPDRAALLAGIAADPDNDLRRLVFADWLDDHGEPERAEFIRLQIERPRLADLVEMKSLNARVGELFQAHAADWFAPFLQALDPQQHIPTGYIYSCTHRARDCVIESRRDSPPLQPYIRGVIVSRGFVEILFLDLTALPSGSSVGAALAYEPVTCLSVSLTADDRRQWTRFSEPGLRHVRRLDVLEFATGPALVAVLPAFGDSHLPAIRAFELSAMHREMEQSIPVATIQVFAESPLAYRVNDLMLRLDDAGLRALCRSEHLQLDKLTVTGTVTAEGVRCLAAARFAPALRSLSARVDDAAIAALARATRFGKLVELRVSGHALTDSGLRALATARFLPQLELLDLSENDYRVTEDAPGLRALADALNPDALRTLRVGCAGHVTAPGYLTARFGNRVTTVH